MKAVKIEAFGGPEALQLVDQPEPSAGPGEAIVQVEAVGVGFVDVMMRSGTYPGVQPGYIPGVEVAGTVLSTGPDTDESLVGKRVYSVVRIGGTVERIAIGAAALSVLPDGVSAADAVGTGVNALVAYFGLKKLHLQPGERLLVRGASGGIGVMALQLAALDGIDVVGATSKPRDLEGLGVGTSVDREASDAGEFDAVFDAVGGGDVVKFIGMLRDEGRYLMAGAAGGFPGPDFGGALLGSFTKSLTMSMQSLNSVKPEALGAALTSIFAMVSDGRLKAVVGKTVPFERLSEGHAALERGEVFGKLVATPA